MDVVRQKTLKYLVPESSGLEAYVGNTPLLPLRRVTLRQVSPRRHGDAQGGARGLPARVQVFAKAEWFNPGGSVKDRPALNILRTAIANGDLTAGKRLLDSTSAPLRDPNSSDSNSSVGMAAQL